MLLCKHFSTHVQKSVVFRFCTVDCLHTYSQVRYPEVRNLLLFNCVQKLSNQLIFASPVKKIVPAPLAKAIAIVSCCNKSQDNSAFCYRHRLPRWSVVCLDTDQHREWLIFNGVLSQLWRFSARSRIISRWTRQSSAKKRQTHFSWNCIVNNNISNTTSKWQVRILLLS